MGNDRDYAEKRFNRPGTAGAAAVYTVAVVAVAGVAFAFYAFGARDSVYAAALVPAFLFLGGVGAMVRTYREWKADRGWAAWQGAGWFLLLLMLVALAIPGSAFIAGGVK
jgi:peptidoglycan/LPS O-acetylase OafA/YrhL